MMSSKIKNLLITLISVWIVIPVCAQHQPLYKIDVNKISDKPLKTIKSDKRLLTVKLDPFGKYVAVGGLNKKLTAYNISTGSVLWNQEGTDLEPTATTNILGMDPASVNPILICAQSKWAGGNIFLFNWETGDNLGYLSPFAGGRFGIDFFVGLDAKVTWTGPEGRVFTYNFSSNAFETTEGWLHHSNDANCIAHGIAGEVYSGGSDGKIVKRGLGAEDEAPTTIMTFERPVYCLTTRPFIQNYVDKQQFIAACDNLGNMKVVSKSGEEQFSYKISGKGQGLEFHPTDPDILIGASMKDLYFFDVNERKLLKSWTFDDNIWSIDISWDGSKLAVGMEEGDVHIYRISDNEMKIEPAELGFIAFDMGHYRSSLPENTKNELAAYYGQRVQQLDCIKVLSKEERESAASRSGTNVSNWAPNQRTAQMMTEPMKIDGYLTAAILDDDEQEGKVYISLVYHEKGKPYAYWSSVVDPDLNALKIEVDKMLTQVCNSN